MHSVENFEVRFSRLRLHLNKRIECFHFFFVILNPSCTKPFGTQTLIPASLLHILDSNYPSFYLKCPRKCQKTKIMQSLVFLTYFFKSYRRKTFGGGGGGVGSARPHPLVQEGLRRFSYMLRPRKTHFNFTIKT